MVVLVNHKNKEVQAVRHYFSQCKSKEIFSDAQGQLTLQSVFRFGQNLNSIETLWFSSQPAKNAEDLI